jgi:hypothetical protein
MGCRIARIVILTARKIDRCFCSSDKKFAIPHDPLSGMPVATDLCFSWRKEMTYKENRNASLGMARGGAMAEAVEFEDGVPRDRPKQRPKASLPGRRMPCCD